MSFSHIHTTYFNYQYRFSGTLKTKLGDKETYNFVGFDDVGFVLGTINGLSQSPWINTDRTFPVRGSIEENPQGYLPMMSGMG